jgi:hypothetical protein
MLLRSRFIVPAAQVLLAMVLLLAGYQQLQTVRGRRMYKDFGSPAMRLAYAINAPASLLRMGCMNFGASLGTHDSQFLNILSDGVFIIGVGFLWFFVAIDVSARHYGKFGISPHRRSLRFIFYFSAILLGIALALLGVGFWLGKHIFGMPMGEVIAETTLYCSWGSLLIFIYGRDLVKSFFIRNTALLPG